MSEQMTISVPGELLDRLADVLVNRLRELEAPEACQFMPVEEAAEYLGCSVDHVRALYRRRAVRAFRPGRRILVDVKSLDEYIRSVPV